MLRSWVLLHVVVLAWGLTSVIGKLIHLPPFSIVAWRAWIAVAALAVILRFRGASMPAMKSRLLLVGTGFIIGAHWYLFFLATKTGGPSACLTGVATAALWTALLEPVFDRTKRWQWIDGALAVIMTGGVALAVSGEVNVSTVHGVLIGVVAAVVATVFSLLNVRFVRSVEPQVITYYQMAGAGIFTAGCAFLTASGAPGEHHVPQGMEWVWMLLLSLGCTVFAYSAYVGLLKKLSAFTVSLAGNLEPVYGMVLAVLILGRDEIRGVQFYAGSAVIIACVAAHPLICRRQLRRRSAAGGEGVVPL